MLAACDPSIVEWTVLATTSMVQDAFWLDPYVHDEMHTHICGSGSGVAAVAIAGDRETADASCGLKWPEESVPTRVYRISETGARMLYMVL